MYKYNKTRDSPAGLGRRRERQKISENREKYFLSDQNLKNAPNQKHPKHDFWDFGNFRFSDQNFDFRCESGSSGYFFDGVIVDFDQ